MKRVRYDRSSLDSTVLAAIRLGSESDLFVYATAGGFGIERSRPVGIGQKYVIVRPDGTYAIERAA